MILLDENIPEDQRDALRKFGFKVRQIGFEVGTFGMADEEIIPLLHKLGDATLITHDRDFFKLDWIHSSYCLAFLDVPEDDLADVARRFLQHSAFNTSAKRMGTVVSVSRSGIGIFQKKRRQPLPIDWEE